MMISMMIIDLQATNNIFLVEDPNQDYQFLVIE